MHIYIFDRRALYACALQSEGCQMSGTGGMPNGNGEELCIDVDALATGLQTSITEMKLIEANSKSGKGKRPVIPMVPKLLHGGESNAFEPKILSLGPYHHHKHHLQAMKQLKLLYLGRFLNRNQKISLRQYLEQVREREREARMVYAEDFNIASNDFVKMLLLDCCFVLELAMDMSDPKDDYGILTCSPFVNVRYSSSVMMQDMLLLENQLPFFLIRHLFNSVLSSMAVKSLEELLSNFFKYIVPFTMKIPPIGSNNGHSRTPNPPQSNRDFLHILHLVHPSLIPKNIPPHEPRKMLRCLTSCYCCFRNHAKAYSPHKFIVPWTPCATELNSAGIFLSLKKKKDGSGGRNYGVTNAVQDILYLNLD